MMNKIINAPNFARLRTALAIRRRLPAVVQQTTDMVNHTNSQNNNNQQNVIDAAAKLISILNRRLQPIVNVLPFTCGEMNDICAHCQALRFAGETPGMCCGNGRYRLPAPNACPPELQQLLVGNDAQSRHFRSHIRAYNSALAFTSVGVNLDRNLTPNGVYTYRIQGALYHRIGSLLPAAGEQPKFSQLYFHDTENETANRLAVLGGLDETVLNILQQILHSHNNILQTFKQAIQQMQGQPIADLKLVLRDDVGGDRRRYNRPTASEIAAIVPADELAGVERNRDIIISQHNGRLQRISEMHCAYDPLHYVLLFPTGELGWNIQLRSEPMEEGEQGKKMSLLKFSRYRLMERQGEFSIPLHSGRLLHQYIVDTYVRCEQQ
jgi:hypothetical protein